jgi:medium-chain acyl-[acyl-carrier-protein] hydrolase
MGGLRCAALVARPRRAEFGALRLNKQFRRHAANRGSAIGPAISPRPAAGFKGNRMKQVVWTQSYAVNSIVANAQKRLGLVGLLNILQDIAWIHAEHLGHGYEATMEAGAAWILSRQALVMSAWPNWGDELRVRTWVRPTKGPLVHRDYQILVGDRQLGECVASWLTLDVRTRRPMRPGAAGGSLDFRVDGELAFTPEKIALREDLAETARFSVRNSDLDMNGHVNNTRYAQWILDSAPLESHPTRRVERYAVNFLAEVQVGDAVAIDAAPPETSSGPQTQMHFQGRRLSDGAQAFAAVLTVAER